MLDSMDLSESRQDGVLLSLIEVGNGRGAEESRAVAQSTSSRGRETGTKAERASRSFQMYRRSQIDE